MTLPDLLESNPRDAWNDLTAISGGSERVFTLTVDGVLHGVDVAEAASPRLVATLDIVPIGFGVQFPGSWRRASRGWS